MLEHYKHVGYLGIALTLIISVAFVSLPNEVGAKTKVVAIEGMRYNVDASLVDNLNALIGKKVYVTLNSGKTLAGIVKEVGNHLMHLEKLDGKDHFDALVRIESISAIDTRFRTVQR